MMSIVLCNDRDDALLAYLIKTWSESNKKGMGRTLVQKVCYFLKARGTPLRFKFEIHHYGPYSEELFFEMDKLEADEIVLDLSPDDGRSEYVPGPSSDVLIKSFSEDVGTHSSAIHDVVGLFTGAKPAVMELLSTVHYQYMYALRRDNRIPADGQVVELVTRVKKDKFGEELILDALRDMKKAWVLGWKG